jgi:hypothetical protein
MEVGVKDGARGYAQSQGLRTEVVFYKCFTTGLGAMDAVRG